jgi:zeaxanthin glucosyltransferase
MFPWQDLDPARPIVYASLGSHPSDYGDASHRVFRTMIEAMGADADWQAVLAIGPDLDPQDFQPHGAHILVRRWAPQMQVLARSAVMVTHAGMGAVNECILTGVPMVALPMARDQHENARRIGHHGLGVAGDAATVTADALRVMLTEVMGDPRFRARVALMRERSRESGVEAGVQVVEQAICASRPRFAGGQPVYPV